MRGPPMTPSTALVMCAPVGADASGSRRRNPPTPWRVRFAALVSDRPRARSRARIFARRRWLELLRMQFHLVPHLLLGEVEKPGKHDQENEHLHAEALSCLEVRLGRPTQGGGGCFWGLFRRPRRAGRGGGAAVRSPAGA